MKHSSNLPPRAGAAPAVRAWLLAGAALTVAHARADEISWSSTSGGTFSVGANWIGGVVPGTSSRAVFSRWRPQNPQPAYTVSFVTNPTNQAVSIGGDNVTFDLNGHAYLLSDTANVIIVGTTTGSSGRLTIIDGVVASSAIVPPFVRIGNNGVPGSLTISTGGQLLGPELSVGGTGPGTLTVQNGGDLVGRSMQIGTGIFGFSGSATVTGAGSGAVVEALAVGVRGSGTLNIVGGGRVECTSAQIASTDSGVGTVNVGGADSRCTSSGDLNIGSAGTGTLNITDGGLVECDASAVGSGLSGVGTLFVSGANSKFLCSEGLAIGASGLGTMAVTDGGRVESSSGTVGNAAGDAPTATVGGNSQWIMTGALTVGLHNDGASELNITGGSLVRSSGGHIGSFQAVGVVNVDGAGTRWLNSGSLTLGLGDGTLNITGGGFVTCADSRIAAFPGATNILASISGTGSQLTIAGSVSVGGDFFQGVDIGPGTLEIGPGGTVSVDSIFIYPQGVVALLGGTLDVSIIARTFSSSGLLLFQDGILHVGFVHFSVLNQGGTLAPGHSAGSTSINGSYTQQAAGKMSIEIGGTAPGTQFDQVVVAGAANLGGTLRLRLISGFVPTPAQAFVVLDAAGITGAFANVASGERLAVSDGGGGSFVVHYGPGSPFDPTLVVLSGFSRACAADFNHDNTVDAQDFFDFIEAFFAGDADFNGIDGTDSQDYFDFLSAFFAGC